MGNWLQSPTSTEDDAAAAANKIRTKKAFNPALRPLASNKEAATVEMDGAERGEGRVPLKEVVADCTRRWFQDTLKEARAGDSAMQVLVAQMYQSGYGVPKNEQKANAWITKVSRYRSTVWKVSDKHPGYNASDSDSDEEKNNLEP